MDNNNTNNTNNPNNNGFTPEQLKQIAQLLQTLQQSQAEPNSIVSQTHNSIRREVEDNKARESQVKKEKELAVFLASIYNNIDKDAPFLPTNAKNIVDTCMRNGDSDEYKVNLIKKELLDGFFEIQSNVDMLSDRGRSELQNFLSLTDEGKMHKASSAYHLMEEVINVKKNLYVQEENKKRKYGIEKVNTNGVSERENQRNQRAKDALLGRVKNFE